MVSKTHKNFVNAAELQSANDLMPGGLIRIQTVSTNGRLRTMVSEKQDRVGRREGHSDK